MDPLTQLLLGSVTAGATMGRRFKRRALLLGAVGGELPDLDVFLAPLGDPALPFELHRHFTHSLLFIPLGGLLATAPFLLLRSFRKQAVAAYAAATIGCATHGLLDNCTSYGTHLLWPFLAQRTAWDCMSIIDPIFTALLLFGLVLALIMGGRPWPARVPLAAALAYIGLGFLQHERAAAVQRQLAAQRGHEALGARVMPTLGNLVLWRSVYEDDGVLYADAIRIAPAGAPLVRVGSSRPRVALADLPPGVAPERSRDVFMRFSAFATGLVAAVPGTGPGFTVADMRYSLDTAGFEPLWGLHVAPDGAAEAVHAVSFRSGRAGSLDRLCDEVFHGGAGYRPLAASE